MTIDSVSCFRSNETTNAYWIPLQIIFGSHNFLKATNRVAPIRKKQQSEWQNPQDVPAMWPGGRGEVGLGCPYFKPCPDLLYTLLKWMRIKTIITPLLTSPKQPLFIMAYSSFAPWSYGWRGDKNAGKMSRWQVALRVSGRGLHAEERNDNSDNILSN